MNVSSTASKKGWSNATAYAASKHGVQRRKTVRALYRFAGVDDSSWSPEHQRCWNLARSAPVPLDGPLRRRLVARLSEDADRLRELAGR